MPEVEGKPIFASGVVDLEKGTRSMQLQSYWEALADKLERQPELLNIALQNITRWRAAGHSAPHRLEEWHAVIVHAQCDAEGFRRLIENLRGSDSRSERLREFSPFAGTLTREERRRTRELCGYRH